MEPTWGFDGCWKSRLSVQRQTIITNKFVSKIEPWSNFVLYFSELEFLSGFLSQGFCSFRGQEARRKVSGNTVLAEGACSSLVKGPDRKSSSSNSCLQAEGWLKENLKGCLHVPGWKDKHKEVGRTSRQEEGDTDWPEMPSAAKANSCLLHVLGMYPAGGTLSPHKLLQSHLSKRFHPSWGWPSVWTLAAAWSLGGLCNSQ